MVEVVPSLLLGSMGDVIALLGHHHKSHSVNQLLSILNTPIDWSEIKTPQGNLMVKFISLPDLPCSDLLSHFPACYKFIDECIQNDGNVLVHCEHGISRSATVVVAYLMKKRNMSFLKALTFLRDRKSDVRPNVGFQEQLKLWEIMNFQLDDSCKSYRAYVLHHQAIAMKKNGYTESMALSPNPSLSHIDSGVVYKCRKCRHILLSSESVLQHELGNGESAFPKHRHGNGVMNYFIINEGKKKQTMDEYKSNSYQTTTDENDAIINTNDTLDCTCTSDSQFTSNGKDVMAEQSALRSKVSSLQIDVSTDNSVCSSLFVEPVEWMGPFILGCKDGKLLCPKCSSRIGSFDWSGTQCSCGKWVTPAFKVVKSKLDLIHVKQ